MASLLCFRDEEREPDKDAELMQGSAGRMNKEACFRIESGCFYMYLYKNMSQGLPDNPVVKTSPSNAGDTSSIPGWGAHIPPASEPRGQGVEQAYSGSSIVANSIVFFFLMVHIKKNI